MDIDEAGSVVVTGAARGIGETIARRFAGGDRPLLLIDRDPSVAALADELGARALVVDVTDSATLRTTLTPEIERRTPWLLVNNHGVFDKTPILEIDLDRWDQVQDINVRSMVALIQLVAPAMIAGGRGGRIVNMASMAAKLGTPGEAAYSASKAGVVALSRIAAMEFGAHEITVNAICPGYVLTDMGAATRSESQVAEWSAMSPLGRLACPDDVAELTMFLSSEGAGYLTGEALNVTGGMCTW